MFYYPTDSTNKLSVMGNANVGCRAFRRQNIHRESSLVLNTLTVVE